MLRRQALTIPILLAGPAAGQPPGRQQDEPKDLRLPSGKMQKEEILRHDYEKTLQDAGELLKLAEELKIDLEKNDRHILSMVTLKKIENIEKVTRRIKSRMTKY
jgi:hypothetical protein